MNLLTMSDTVNLAFTRSIGTFPVTCHPYVPYVFARPQHAALTLPQVKGKVFRSSSLEPRLKNFNVNDPKRGRVLLYNGCGGFGDQILTWPISKILDDYGYEVHVLADPGNDICWQLFPWVKGIHVLPIQFSMLELFDHHAFFEIVSNMDEHQDQAHPVDAMLHKIGIDPTTIDVSRKSVKPFFSAAEMDEEAALFKGQHVAIFQLHSGSVTRSLIASESVYLLKKLAETFPTIAWVAIHDNLMGESHRKELTKDALPENIQICFTRKLRLLWALAQRAKVVVCPDSMMVHIAGVLEVPCVGLWGPTNPDSRVAYYKNHHPVWPKEACPHCPCYTFLQNFPHFCPTSTTGPRNQCEVISHIQPADVISAVERAMSNDRNLTDNGHGH